MKFEAKALEEHKVRTWPHVAGNVRAGFEQWRKRMAAVGAAEHVETLRGTRDEEDGHLVLEMAVGDVVAHLTFVSTNSLLYGRVLLCRPAEPAVGRAAQPIFSLTIDDQGDIYTGDQLDRSWPEGGGDNYGFTRVQDFLQQLMAAIVADENARVAAG